MHMLIKGGTPEWSPSPAFTLGHSEPYDLHLDFHIHSSSAWIDIATAYTAAPNSYVRNGIGNAKIKLSSSKTKARSIFIPRSYFPLPPVPVEIIILVF